MIATVENGRDFNLADVNHPGVPLLGGTRDRSTPLVPGGEAPSAAFHALRGLLTTVQVTTDVLVDFSSLTTTEIEQVVGRLQRGVLHLDTVMENLAITATVASGRISIRPSPVPLDELIEAVVSRVEPLFKQTGKSLRHALPIPESVVNVDSRRLQQALLNLLINASNYGALDDVVDLTVCPEHDQVEIRVTDCGPGIPTSEHLHIFEPQFRGEVGISRYPGGLGLGLYVTKVLIELHGGTTGVDSQPGRGASFWIRLPALAG